MKDLRELRRLKNITQVDLAKKCNITQASIANFEAGSRKPSYKILLKIAEALDIDPKYVTNIISYLKSKIKKEIKTLNFSECEDLLKYIEFLKHKRNKCVEKN